MGTSVIAKALSYCVQVIRRLQDTVMVMVTDLYEGGNAKTMLQHFAYLVESGVQVIVLLALADDGAPVHHEQNAQALAALGIPCFACTPELFPDLMAAALNRQDISAWAAQNITATTRV